MCFCGWRHYGVKKETYAFCRPLEKVNHIIECVVANPVMRRTNIKSHTLFLITPIAKHRMGKYGAGGTVGDLFLRHFPVPKIELLIILFIGGLNLS